MSRQGTIVLSAGGTGGHMFPALALAQALIARKHRVALFTDARGQRYAREIQGLESANVRSASPSRGGILGKIGFLFTLSRGALTAARLLRRVQARLVVGFGGYAAFPTCFMAARQGRPVILHEQNAHLGLANRMLRDKAAAIALSFEHVEAVPESGVKLENTGNPVRNEIIALHDRDYAAPEPGGKLRILILGGSQGARIFSDVLPDAARQLGEDERKRLEITQQCRPEDLDRVREAYAKLGVSAELDSFFEDVPERLGGAHLVVCRAGASTVAEVLVAGLPAIFVPYPHAADDHQSANARAMAEAGAGWHMPQPDFTPETLGGRLRAILADPTALGEAAAAAKRAAKPDAAERLAELVETVLEEAA